MIHFLLESRGAGRAPESARLGVKRGCGSLVPKARPSAIRIRKAEIFFPSVAGLLIRHVAFSRYVTQFSVRKNCDFELARVSPLVPAQCSGRCKGRSEGTCVPRRSCGVLSLGRVPAGCLQPGRADPCCRLRKAVRGRGPLGAEPRGVPPRLRHVCEPEAEPGICSMHGTGVGVST